MPAPAVYVLVVVGTVATSVAFLKFVYEPHIAPKVEEWKHQFKARRRARKEQRSRSVPIAVSLSSAKDNSTDEEDDKRSYELEQLVSREILEWRGKVDQSSTIRQRKLPAVRPALGLDEDNPTIPYIPITPTPTHIISDASDASSPTSTISSRALSPPAREFSPNPSGTGAFTSPSLVPSLSLSHPVDLDYEHGVELLSPPSSRPDSPFSAVSHPSSLSDASFEPPSEYFSYADAASERGMARTESESSLSLTSASELSSRNSSISDFSLVSHGAGRA